MRRIKRTIIIVLSLLMIFSLPVVANAASYKKAYKKIVQGDKYESFDYSLIYIDNNKIPELVCSNGGGAFSIYTYKNGKAKCLINNSKGFKYIRSGGKYWWYGSGAYGSVEYYYIPKKNMLYSRFCSRYIGNDTDDGYGINYKYIDYFFSIKNGRFEQKESIIFDMTKTVKKTFSPRKNYKVLIGKYSKKKILKKLK